LRDWPTAASLLEPIGRAENCGKCRCFAVQALGLAAGLVSNFAVTFLDEICFAWSRSRFLWSTTLRFCFNVLYRPSIGDGLPNFPNANLMCPARARHTAGPVEIEQLIVLGACPATWIRFWHPPRRSTPSDDEALIDTGD